MSSPAASSAKTCVKRPLKLGSPPGYSQIVDVQSSHLVFIAGQTALDRDGALIGKNEGDEIEFQAPDGLKTFEVLEVRYE